MTERPFGFPPSEAFVATPPPVAAVEEEPVVLEEAVADVGRTECEAAGEVLDAAAAVGVL